MLSVFLDIQQLTSSLTPARHISKYLSFVSARPRYQCLPCAWELTCVYWGVSRFRFGWLVGGQLFGISHLAYFVPCLPQIRVPLTEPHYVSQNPCVSRCPTMCPTTRGFSNMIHGLDKRQATASFSTEWHPTLNLHFSVVEFHWVSLLHCWCHTQGVVWLIWRSVRMSLGICPGAKLNLRSIAFQT